MEDLSDDVSALSMDGASTIGRDIGFTKRLKMKISDVQRLGIIEDAAENDNAGVDHYSRGSSNNNSARRHDGNELIEPFPKTFEEWKEEKEKKKKQKHKSSKKSHKKSRKRDKERDDNMAESSSSANKLPPIPIKEIAIMSSSRDSSGAAAARQSPDRSNISFSRRSRTTTTGSSGLCSHSHNSITSCTTDSSTENFSSSRRSSSIVSGPGSSGVVMGKASTTSPRRSSSHHHSHHRNRSSDLSDSYTSQSHVTVDKINQIKLDLERARLEEKQVLEIYQHLEMEVTSLEKISNRFQQQQEQIHQELESASMERYQLQRTLVQLQGENDKLRAKVRKVEEKEDRKRLDDVLDSMESKMRALKLQSKRSKDKKKS